MSSKSSTVEPGIAVPAPTTTTHSERVARARALINDSDYPGPAALEVIARGVIHYISATES